MSDESSKKSEKSILANLDSPTLDHFSDENNEKSDDTENDYDFGSAGSRQDSDEDSWETVSEELRAEALEHNDDGLCFCSSCSMKSISLSSRIQNRSLYEEDDLPENAVKVTTDTGAKIYVVGTAHFSEASQDDVKKAIQHLSPDVVMVELCLSRIGVLKYDEESLLKAAQDVSVAKLKLAIKESGSVVSGIMQLLLLSMSAHITKQLGMAPGGEFRVAAKQARKVPGCRLVLGDRPIQATLGRAMSSLSLFQKMKLAWHLIFSKDNITKEDVEKYKQKDMIAEMLAEMTGDFPELSRVFVLERDQYMAQMLLRCVDTIRNDLPDVINLNNEDSDTDRKNESKSNVEDKSGKEGELNNEEESVSKDRKADEKETLTLQRKDYQPVIVGVVGIGHMNGIVNNIGKHVDMDELMTIPPPSYMNRAFKMAVKAAIVAALSWGVYSVWKWVKTA